MKPFLTSGLFLMVGLLAFSGCQKKQVKTNDPTSSTGMVDPDDAEASIRGKDYESIPELKTIPFDYDSPRISPTARRILNKNAEWLRKNKTVEVRIEGHCDERGTTEYNLSLGQRRASAIRDYYKAMGISVTRMATISFGREWPVCSEMTESCWEQNRRGETRAKKKVS